MVDEVGDPSAMLQALRDRVQEQNVQTFGQVQDDFLALMWALDSFRSAEVVPPTPAGTRARDGETGEGLYRSKGNFFSEVVTLILDNKTSSKLAPRSRVWGFSQVHQIDIAWPDRSGKPLEDPLVCCEAKLSGAPAYGRYPERSGRADFSNRRKELKFQATDLKLYRQQAATSILHWDTWRRVAPPRVFVVWAARLVSRAEYPRMVEDAQSLRDTYLDGVGIFGYVVNEAGTGYDQVMPRPSVAARVASLDNVLDMMAAEIQSIMQSNGNRVPPPVVPSQRATSVEDPDEN